MTASDTLASAVVNLGETPVIPGFHPDPTVCRVGDEYFVANSSFEYTPGVPLWRSDDLVTWTQVGNALSRDDQFRPGAAAPNQGVYAPTLRHHDGRFWLITTNVGEEPGQIVVSAPAIEGPWGDAVRIPDLHGIDPDLAWDEQGTCIVSYCASDPALGGIAQAPVDLATGRLLAEPRGIWSGTGLQYPEGPHLYRRGDWWYLLIAEGGTERGHAVSIARAGSPSGPFESAPHNPLLTRRSTAWPVQNTGHADLVERADGTWAMVYLGVRPRGTTPGFHVNGRETFVAEIDWVDDWPIVLTDVARPAPAPTDFTDDFSAATLHPRWVSPGAALAAIAAPHPDGGIALRAVEADNGAPALLSVRATDLRWRYTAQVAADAAVALRVRMDERHWYEVQLAAGRAVVEARIGPLQHRVGVETSVTAGEVTIEVSAVDPTAEGPDDVAFAVVDAAGRHDLARLDGRYLSTEVAGGFIGRTLGLRALGADARVSGVRYEAGAAGGAPVESTA